MPDAPRLEVDRVLRCPRCRVTVYRVFRRQVSPSSVVYESVLWPVHPSVGPPARSEQLLCPDCGTACVSEAP